MSYSLFILKLEFRQTVQVISFYSLYTSHMHLYKSICILRHKFHTYWYLS